MHLLSPKVQAEDQLIQTYGFEDLSNHLNKKIFVIPTQGELLELVNGNLGDLHKANSFGDLQVMGFEYGTLEKITNHELEFQNGSIHERKISSPKTYLVDPNLEQTKNLIHKRYELLKTRGRIQKQPISKEKSLKEQLKELFGKYNVSIPKFIDQENLNPSFLETLERALKQYQKNPQFPLMVRLQKKNEINQLQKRLGAAKSKCLSGESDDSLIERLKNALRN